MMEELVQNGFIDSYDEIKGIGHRVLHGGEIYSSSVVIDDEVLNNIKKLTKLGPLHHPGEIAGIMAMQELMPNTYQVAVFDTAFHQTMPKENYLYAVPYEWYLENGVRKYGFHGTSHKYITEYLKNYYNNDRINAIICHIGSGAIDPSIIEYICKEAIKKYNKLIEAAQEILANDLQMPIREASQEVKTLDVNRIARLRKL